MYMKINYPSVLLIYTGGTIGMIENPETGALENFNFESPSSAQRSRIKSFTYRMNITYGQTIPPSISLGYGTLAFWPREFQ